MREERRTSVEQTHDRRQCRGGGTHDLHTPARTPPTVTPLPTSQNDERAGVPCPEWEFCAHRSSGGTTTGGRRPESRPWAARDWRPHRLTWNLYVTPEPTTSAAGRTSQRTGRREERREAFEKRVEERGGSHSMYLPETWDDCEDRVIPSGWVPYPTTSPPPSTEFCIIVVVLYGGGRMVLRGNERDLSGNKER